jgi:hypothetical protein
MQEVLILIVLLLAIPAGLLCRHLTKDEKNIYSNWQYFPLLKLVFFILAGIFYFFDLVVALSFTFGFIMLLAWDW